MRGVSWNLLAAPGRALACATGVCSCGPSLLFWKHSVWPRVPYSDRRGRREGGSWPRGIQKVALLCSEYWGDPRRRVGSGGAEMHEDADKQSTVSIGATPGGGWAQAGLRCARTLINSLVLASGSWRPCFFHLEAACFHVLSHKRCSGSSAVALCKAVCKPPNVSPGDVTCRG